MDVDTGLKVYLDSSNMGLFDRLRSRKTEDSERDITEMDDDEFWAKVEEETGIDMGIPKPEEQPPVVEKPEPVPEPEPPRLSKEALVSLFEDDFDSGLSQRLPSGITIYQCQGAGYGVYTIRDEQVQQYGLQDMVKVDAYHTLMSQPASEIKDLTAELGIEGRRNKEERISSILTRMSPEDIGERFPPVWELAEPYSSDARTFGSRVGVFDSAVAKYGKSLALAYIYLEGDPDDALIEYAELALDHAGGRSREIKEDLADMMVILHFRGTLLPNGGGVSERDGTELKRMASMMVSSIENTRRFRPEYSKPYIRMKSYMGAKAPGEMMRILGEEMEARGTSADIRKTVYDAIGAELAQSVTASGSLELNRPLTDDPISDCVPIAEADALHIALELYDPSGWEDSVPEGFDLNESMGLIEQFNTHYIHLTINRISDGIAIRYAGIGPYEAITRFLREAYEQALDHGYHSTAESAALMSARVLINEHFLGHYEADGDCPPDRSEKLLEDAAEWIIRGFAAEERYIRKGVPEPRYCNIRYSMDYFLDMSYDGMCSPEEPREHFIKILKRRAERMGPDAVELVRYALGDED